MKQFWVRASLVAALAGAWSAPIAAQSAGNVRGTISMERSGEPLHGAAVLIVELGRSAISGEDGAYVLDDVPPGRYQVVAHLDGLFNEAAKTVEVVAGEATAIDFALGLTPQRVEVTVTSSEKEETAFESFNSVESLDAYDLTFSRDVSLGEALDQRVGTGIAKRSFGPGSSRPIIRGFDGDRVLIMEDGIRTGTLSSQSGDHGEVVNPAQLERLEIIKGPATLLYSGNAMGGTVNAVSRHHELHRHPHEGLRGFVSGSAGTANALAGGSAGFELGRGKWMLWGSTAGTRASDYSAPQVGQIFNSRARMANGNAGLGWFGERTFLSFDFKVDRGRNGVPFAADLHGHEEDLHGHEEEADGHEEEADEGHEEAEEEEIERISLDTRRQSIRLNWGLNQLGRVVDSFVLKVTYTDWEHDEVEFFEDGESEIGTAFRNDQLIYRGVFEQKKHGPLSGRFGFWGIDRAYDVEGEEALSPPVEQDGFAAFTLQELDYERVKFQFGARVETQQYRPAFGERGGEHGHEHGEEDEGDEEPPNAVRRRFTGLSAAAGMHLDLWAGGAFVANYAHSYRAPALEELYNLGPHVGNLAFEVGDPTLAAETGDGFDLSLRQQSSRVHGEANFFYYGFRNFIFPFATGEVEDGLQVIEFVQRDARYIGAEVSGGVRVGQRLWLNLGLDVVDARETQSDSPLPRIPPLRGKIGLDYHWRGLRLAPELILAADQSDTFLGETPTAGYAVVNLKASYTLARRHAAHQFAVNVFNVGDRLYRNHSSFIKDLAPEIGRGVRFTYLVRFF